MSISFIKKMYKNANQRFLAVIALFVVFILIASSIFVYYKYFLEEEKVEEKKEETRVIDDRISPLEDQGLVLEILRIRHRGLLEQLKKPGNSWKKAPLFYFVTNIDGLEYISKNVAQHGWVTEVLFTTWDTICQENKVMKDAEEEQEISTVKLTIVERVKTGLLKRKTADIERDTLTVTYDYRTGRWSGDDNYKDYDGYGHYLGETFEIWFNIYQIDNDGDFIPYWIEVNVLGTDPTVDDSKLDPDNDGIPTAWEWKWGYDPFTWDDHKRLDPDLDGIENIEEYQMAKWFANPYIQNIYYEVDWMGRGGILDPPHIFYEESKQMVTERFSEHNIQIFFDDGWPGGPINGGGQELPHVERISQESGMVLQYYRHYFPDERKGIFRYFIIGHKGGFQHPAVNNVYDIVLLGTLTQKFAIIERIKNFVVFLRPPTARGDRISLGNLLLHETAHGCGISAQSCNFAGIDNMSGGFALFPNKQFKNTWVQYKSVLNYIYGQSPEVMDLSSGENGAPYDQNDWGMIFCAHFQYNSNYIEESTPNPPNPDTMKRVESEWLVTNYTYDANLTEKFVKSIGDYSPVDPIKVKWMIYKLTDKDKNPNCPEVRVYVHPDIKNTDQWVLYKTGNLDSEGNLQFYSFDTILENSKKQSKLF